MLRDAFEIPGMRMLAPGARVSIVGFVPGAVHPDEPGKHLVSGVVETEAGRFMLSVITMQSKSTINGRIRKAMETGRTLAVSGRWAPRPFHGDGGDTYRPLIGQIEVI